jgi:hypothetical protein
MAISDRLTYQPGDHTSGRTYYQDKWARVEGAPTLLWAWAGYSDVGSAITPPIEQSASNWDTLVATVPRMLRSFCGQFSDPRPHLTLTECLVAGWIGGVPGILYVRADGTIGGGWGPNGPRLDEKFVGTGSFSADVAWKYATRHLGAPKTAANFRALLDLVIHEEPQLDGFECWDIPPGGPPVKLEAIDPRVENHGPPYFPPPALSQ